MVQRGALAGAQKHLIRNDKLYLKNAVTPRSALLANSGVPRRAL